MTLAQFICTREDGVPRPTIAQMDCVSKVFRCVLVSVLNDVIGNCPCNRLQSRADRRVGPPVRVVTASARAA